MFMINSSSDSLNNNNNNPYNAYNSFHFNEPLLFEQPNIIDVQNDNGYRESRLDIQNNSNLLNSGSYNSLNNINESNSNINSNSNSDNHTFDIFDFKSKDKNINYEKNSEDNLILLNEQNSSLEQENSKFIQYLIKNNIINENNIIENDISINKEKKNFDNILNDVMNKLKCKSCHKIPNEFFICSSCYSIFCENCLGKDGTKMLKFCINCKKLIRTKEHFIKIPIFNKILTYINSMKENNEKLYNDKMQENLDKNKILCSGDIHNINNDDFLKMDLNDLKNGEPLNNKVKAIYFCIECLKPFCSDCILNYKLKKNKKIENDIKDNINNINIEIDKDKEIDNLNKINEKENETIKKHNYTHPIFKIDLLKDIGIFDLLYEKTKSENIISNLDLIDGYVNDRIEHLNKNKQNLILFLDYIKNIYIKKIEEVINNLKNISKEKADKIQLIKQKCIDLDKFLKNLKTKNDLKNNKNINTMNILLTEFNSFHKIPDEIKKKANKLIKFKGLFDLEQISNFKSDINLNASIFLNNSKIMVRYDNKENGKENDESENENENKIVEEKKINVTCNIKENTEDYNKKNNKKTNEFSIPILINHHSDKNKFINLSEISRNILNKKSDDEENKFFDLSQDIDEGNISFGPNPFRNNNKYDKKSQFKEQKKEKEKKYSTEININEFKKISDDCYKIDFELYNLKIF